MLVARRQDEALLKDCIGELSPWFREAVLLREQELFYREIAGVLNAPIGTRCRRRRARHAEGSLELSKQLRRT